MALEIKGHSGCNLELVTINKRQLILKSTSDEKYKPRLREQGYLQAEALQKIKKANLNGINVPQILTIDNDSTLTMDYVNGLNYIDFFERASVHDVKGLIKKLINLVLFEIDNSEEMIISKNIFIKKLNSVKENIYKNELLGKMKANDYITNGQDTFAEFVDKAIEMVNSFDEIVLPMITESGMIHGDLTFSNIIMQGNECYLIDFLDSFIETPLQDIVKLRQDTYFNWSTLMYKKPKDDTRIKMIMAYYDKCIADEFSQYKWYKYYNMLQTINILRIVPYVKDTTVAINLYKYLKQLTDGK